jgi:hypothetical protein
MHNKDHLTAVGNPSASDEIDARPDDPSSVYISLAEIEEDDTFAIAVNGSKYKPARRGA